MVGEPRSGIREDYLAVQPLGRRSTHFSPADCHTRLLTVGYKWPGRRAWMRAQGWVKSGPGEKAEALWTSAELGTQCGKGSGTGSSRGDSYGCSGGATARVGSQRAASFPAPSRRRSGAPGPQIRAGNPPVPSARVRGHGRPPEPVVSQPRASGRTALRTAAAEGQKSICSGQSWRPAPSARLAELRSTNMHRQRRGFPAGPASLAL